MSQLPGLDGYGSGSKLKDIGPDGKAALVTFFAAIQMIFFNHFFFSMSDLTILQRFIACKMHTYMLYKCKSTVMELYIIEYYTDIDNRIISIYFSVGCVLVVGSTIFFIT